jgi:hypothetical protein
MYKGMKKNFEGMKKYLLGMKKNKFLQICGPESLGGSGAFCDGSPM